MTKLLAIERRLERLDVKRDELEAQRHELLVAAGLSSLRSADVHIEPAFYGSLGERVFEILCSGRTKKGRLCRRFVDGPVCACGEGCGGGGRLPTEPGFCWAHA